MPTAWGQLSLLERTEAATETRVSAQRLKLCVHVRVRRSFH